jgi:rare lipoprotein A (peptidoglycan hydrolase)
MFDCNQFKRSVKDWMRDNNEGTVSDLVDFCEELIPPHLYQSHSWLVEQTASWYRHVLMNRERANKYRFDDEDFTA